MQSALHLEIVDATPRTPTSNHGPKAQSSTERSQLHTSSSHQKSGFSTLKSPLRSLRSRRKANSPVNQSPTLLKRKQSLFDLFHASRSRALDNIEASKDGIDVNRPKTASPAKNTTTDNEYHPARPKRSKSFSELLGTRISNKILSKYDTTSQRGQRQANISHDVQSGRIVHPLGNNDWEWVIKPGTAEAYIFSAQQEQHIQQLETEMDTFWHQEQIMDSFKHNQIKSLLGHDTDCESSTNSWKSSLRTLRETEALMLDRSIPKLDDEVDVSISPEPYLGPWLTPSKHSVTASYDNMSCMVKFPSDSKPLAQQYGGSLRKANHHNNIISIHQHDRRGSGFSSKPGSNIRHICPVSRGQLAAKKVEPKTLDIEQSSPKVTNGIGIAERIQLTVDEMTNNRYMNRSVDGLDLKFVDQILADSVSIRTPDAPFPSFSSAAEKAIGPELNSQQLPKKSGIVCSKSRVESQKGCTSLRRSRQVSTGPVRVNFPDTKNRAAYIGIYRSSSEAISGIFEKNHGQLSSVCAYDRGNRIIHVYLLQHALSPNQLRQRGLEPIWLPLGGNPRSGGLLDAMLEDDVLFQKDNLSVPTGVTPSRLSSSPNERAPMENTGINRQSETQSQRLAELLTTSQAYPKLDESNLSSKHILTTDSQTLAPSAHDSHTGMQANRSLGTNPDIPTHMAIADDVNHRAKINPTSNFRLNQGSTCNAFESDSDGSILKLEYNSEPDDSNLSQVSRPSEEYGRIMSGTESDIGDEHSQQSCLGYDFEPRLQSMKKKGAYESFNIDKKRKSGMKDCMNESPLSGRSFYIGITKMISKPHCDGTQHHASVQHPVEGCKYFATEEIQGPIMSVENNDNLHPSPRSQLDSTGADGESDSVLSYASGFAFTAYADELLGSEKRCESGEHSSLMNENQRERPMISRHDSGVEISPQERSKIDPLRTVLIPRHNGERQSVTASRDSRHGPSNSVNVLSDIDEVGETDVKKCFADTPAKSQNRSTEKWLGFANSDKTPDNTIAVPHCEGSCYCTGNEQLLDSDMENKQKNVAGLVNIFQARGMIGQGLISGLQRIHILSNSVNQCSGGLSSSSTQIVTPSGAVYSPSAAPKPSCRPSSVNRVPTPHSFSLTNTSFSDTNTETSSLFGERLERAAVGSSKNGQSEGSEWYFRDGEIYG